MKEYKYEVDLFGKLMVEKISARSFKFALRKLERIFDNLPVKVIVFDDSNYAWKVRT